MTTTVGVDSTIFVVDDDELGRASVQAVVTAKGYRCKAFESAEEFLEYYRDDEPGCVVTDLRLLGRTGLELQEELLARGRRIPLIVLTGFARTPVTVRAMRNGAITILDKPCSDEDLSQAISLALEQDRQRRAADLRRSEIRRRLEKLTASEHQVLNMLLDGLPNKAIALRLDVSERTVESRRHEIFTKLRAHSIAELVRTVISASEDPPSACAHSSR